MKKPQHCGLLNNNVTNYIRTTCIYNSTATVKRPELAPLSALGHSTRQILIFSTATIKRPELAP